MTKKPIPLRRNINVPVGYLPGKQLVEDLLHGELLIFSQGEKHPVNYSFYLVGEDTYFYPEKRPVGSINQQITYTMSSSQIKIINNESNIMKLSECSTFFSLDGERYYLKNPGYNIKEIEVCNAPVYVK